ncbi:MAG: hypothetical protein IT288_03615 [Bdellovibrionales bacterium]|nr:hypothetical protein [Bdellovibrionales bacterium]
MEGLAPPLKFILFLRLEIENGNSIRVGLDRYLDRHSGDEMSSLLERWLGQREAWGTAGLRTHRGWTVWRQSVIEVLERGLVGEAILESLGVLEIEVGEAAQAQLENDVSSLPFQALVPVLMFQFPAFMMLLVGPLLQDLVNGMA